MEEFSGLIEGLGEGEMGFVIGQEVGGDFKLFKLVLEVSRGERFAIDNEGTFGPAVVGIVKVFEKVEVEVERGGFDEGGGDWAGGNEAEERMEGEFGFEVKEDVVDWSRLVWCRKKRGPIRT